MRLTLLPRLLAAVVAAVALSGSEVQANWFGFGMPWSLGYSVYTQDYVPYFARNPPVYYHYPTYYRYGRSPFPAMPACGECNTSAPAAAPLVVINRYTTALPSAETPAAAPATVSNHPLAIKPLVVRNPFIEQTNVASRPRAD
jgi:hypothetical protein